MESKISYKIMPAGKTPAGKYKYWGICMLRNFKKIFSASYGDPKANPDDLKKIVRMSGQLLTLLLTQIMVTQTNNSILTSGK
ncbi:hypothetical protein E2320_007623 [Naja naja]|nr:hypothetical protein E2320_007623 [Naja naja]